MVLAPEDQNIFLKETFLQSAAARASIVKIKIKGKTKQNKDKIKGSLKYWKKGRKESKREL